MSLAYLEFGFVTLVNLLGGTGSSRDFSRVVDEDFLLGEVEEDEFGEDVEELTSVAIEVGC